jgi:MFS family permease
MADPSPKSDDFQLKQKTMRRSILEGSFAAPSLMLGDNYIVPFAFLLGASTLQVGILTSLASFIAPSAQILGSRFMVHRTRKKILIRYVLAQALIWIPIITIGILSLLFPGLAVRAGFPWILLGLFCIYQFFGGFITPSWISLLGDIVPNRERGRYFGRRNLILTAISILFTVGVSFGLDWLTKIGFALIGFLIIFGLAFLGRGASSLMFHFHYDPPFDIDYQNHLTFPAFLRQLGKNNFGRFTLMISLVSFGQWISAPFFVPYMLKGLEFSYSTFILVNISSAVFSLFVFRPFGKFADKFGNLRLLIFGSIFVPIVPVLWVFFKGPIGLIFGAQLISGIGWSAFNLASSNFIYDNIPISRRGEYVAYYSFIVGIGAILGGLLGSFLIQILPTVNFWQYRIIFIISGVVRMIPILICLPKLKEVGPIDTKEILNIENQPIYRFLYDLRLREKITRKKKTKSKLD